MLIVLILINILLNFPILLFFLYLWPLSFIWNHPSLHQINPIFFATIWILYYRFRNEHITQCKLKRDENIFSGDLWKRYFPLSLEIIWQISLPSSWYEVRKCTDHWFLDAIPWPKRRFKMKPVWGNWAECQIKEKKKSVNLMVALSPWIN